MCKRLNGVYLMYVTWQWIILFMYFGTFGPMVVSFVNYHTSSPRPNLQPSTTSLDMGHKTKRKLFMVWCLPLPPLHLIFNEYLSPPDFTEWSVRYLYNESSVLTANLWLWRTQHIINNILFYFCWYDVLCIEYINSVKTSKNAYMLFSSI